MAVRRLLISTSLPSRPETASPCPFARFGWTKTLQNLDNDQRVMLDTERDILEVLVTASSSYSASIRAQSTKEHSSIVSLVDICDLA